MLNLNTVVLNLDKMLERLISEDIEVRTKLVSNLWPVNVDPVQIEQLIVNLAVNAVDAMPEGGKLIVETANEILDENYSADHPDVQTGEYVLLAVSDTGLGMTEEIKRQIFEPFFTTKKPGKDMGLGLTTVLGIVKQSGGYIDVYSELGCGTTFKIYLPRVKEAIIPVNQPVRRADHLPTGTETILLVEDEAKIRDMGDRLLRRQGYTVLTAADGGEALQVTKQHTGKIHLLLTDLVMPHMNGKVLAERIRELYPDIKILFTSGYRDKAIVQQAGSDANVDFIQKPFAIVEFIRKVRSVLDS